MVMASSDRCMPNTVYLFLQLASSANALSSAILLTVRVHCSFTELKYDAQPRGLADVSPYDSMASARKAQRRHLTQDNTGQHASKPLKPLGVHYSGPGC